MNTVVASENLEISKRIVSEGLKEEIYQL